MSNESVCIRTLDIKKKVGKIEKYFMGEEETKMLEARCRELAKKLAGLTLISQGSVMRQPPSAWRWTRKVSGKTVSRGLSTEQAALMKRAIANQRKMDEIIDELRVISQKLVFALPGNSRKRGRVKNPKSA